MTTKRPSSVPKVASSKRHLMLAPAGPGVAIKYACTNSAGGDPGTLSVPDSSQHAGRCAISARPIASSGSPSARHSVPFAVHTAGSNRNVCAMRALWRARAVSGYVASQRQPKVPYVDGTHLVGKQLTEFSLSDRLRRDRRGARRRSARVAAVPGGGAPARLGGHADSPHAPAHPPHRRAMPAGGPQPPRGDPAP